MKKALLVVLAVVVSPLVASLMAHHSFDAEFDRNKPITLNGEVTRVEWTNPHIWIFIDVTEESGEVTNWGVEGSAPNALFRRGWRQDSVKFGDILTVEGYRARDDSLRANAVSVVLQDGSRVFAGSSIGEAR